MAMKTTEIQQFVKETVVRDMGIAEKGTEIGRYKYAVPVETPEDGVVYATVSITCTKWQSTEKTTAFDLDEAVANYNAEEAERAEKARERAEKSAQKKAEKEAKKAKSAE